MVLLLHLSQGTAVAAAPWVQGGYVASLGEAGRNGSLTVSFVDAQRATVTLRLRRLAPRAMYTIRLVRVPCSPLSTSFWRDRRAASPSGTITADIDLGGAIASKLYGYRQIPATLVTGLPCASMRVFGSRGSPPALAVPPKAGPDLSAGWPAHDVVPVLAVPSDVLLDESADVAAIAAEVADVQTFYATQLSGRTFTAAPVRVVRTGHPVSHYGFDPSDAFVAAGATGRLGEDVIAAGVPATGRSGHVFLMFVAGSPGYTSRGGTTGDALNGYAWLADLVLRNVRLPAREDRGLAYGLIAHEIGHTFGLHHPVEYGGNNQESVMGSAPVSVGLSPTDRYNLLASRYSVFFPGATSAKLAPTSVSLDSNLSARSRTTTTAATSALQEADGNYLRLTPPFGSFSSAATATFAGVPRDAARLLVSAVSWVDATTVVSIRLRNHLTGSWDTVGSTRTSAGDDVSAVSVYVPTGSAYVSGDGPTGNVDIQLEAHSANTSGWTVAWDVVKLSLDAETSLPVQPGWLLRASIPTAGAQVGESATIFISANQDPVSSGARIEVREAGATSASVPCRASGFTGSCAASVRATTPGSHSYEALVIGSDGSVLATSAPVTTIWAP